MAKSVVVVVAGFLCVILNCGVAAQLPASIGKVHEFNRFLEKHTIGNADEVFASMPQNQIDMLYQDFLATMGSVNDDGEKVHVLSQIDYLERSAAFKESIGTILKLNARHNNFGEAPVSIYGITGNADFSSHRWGMRKNARVRSKPNLTVEGNANTKNGMQLFSPSLAEEAPLPVELFHRDTCPVAAAANDVRQQGQCGACYAFATAEMIRYNYQMIYGEDPGVLSAQYIVDCTQGCSGGDPNSVVDYLIKNGGIPTAAAYGPWSGGPGTCNQNVPKAVVPGPTFTAKDEETMYSWYCSNGPFAISIASDPIQHYRGGVITSATCQGATDHEVIVIGMIQYQGTQAWLAQNSWGVNWGVTETGAPAPIDKYSNCADLASDCDGQTVDGDVISAVCPRSCASGPVSSGGFFLLKFGDDACNMDEEATFLSDVFSDSGGQHPWTHSEPLLHWDAYWGPYNGISFSSGSAPQHSSQVASLAACEAATEAHGDDVLIYAESGSCVSSSGSVGFKSSGVGPSATVYQKGNGPAVQMTTLVDGTPSVLLPSGMVALAAMSLAFAVSKWRSSRRNVLQTALLG